MSQPKIEAVVICQSAVFTDPWWHLIGVMDELWLRNEGQARFDAYVKLAKVIEGQDYILRTAIIDPGSGQVIAESAGVCRPDLSGNLERTLGFDLVFPREDEFFVELWLNDMFLDARTIRVNILE